MFPTFFRVQIFKGHGFARSRFFRVQVFQGPGVQVLEGAQNNKQQAICDSKINKSVRYIFRTTETSVMAFCAEILNGFRKKAQS